MQLVENKNFISSVKNAFMGIKIAILESKNLRRDIFVAILVIFFGWFFKVNRYEWIVILICIGAVMSAEIFNTAIEDIENILRDKAGVPYEFTGKAKDLAAGAVLFFAIISVIIASIIFTPKIIEFLSQTFLAPVFELLPF